mmetsp:Transcript_54499/g.118000  ORF Transcript_54499/g.118000 Transcript_54499/m.118000 type:complete len:220 (+) Transcript_54499:551-1210(+)
MTASCSWARRSKSSCSPISSQTWRSTTSSATKPSGQVSASDGAKLCSSLLMSEVASHGTVGESSLPSLQPAVAESSMLFWRCRRSSAAGTATISCSTTGMEARAERGLCLGNEVDKEGVAGDSATACCTAGVRAGNAGGDSTAKECNGDWAAEVSMFTSSATKLCPDTAGEAWGGEHGAGRSGDCLADAGTGDAATRGSCEAAAAGCTTTPRGVTALGE